MITAYIRDIAIIIIAVQSIIIGVLIAVLIFQIWRLMKMVQTEIKPILEDAQETLNTVRGTTTFVSNNVVEPVAKTGGYIAGARRTMQVMRNEVTATMNTWRGTSPASRQTPPTSEAARNASTGPTPSDAG